MFVDTKRGIIRMKVFLSWSVQGSQSHQVAEALRDWLPSVIQQVRPWLSSQDIKTGSRWQAELNKELQDTRFGIFSITNESKDRPYLMFEAGALSRYVEAESFVCPYYFGLKPTDVKNPISDYQGSEATKEGTLSLLKALNSALPNDSLPNETLEKSFEMWWPELEKRLKYIRENVPTQDTHELANIRTDREILEELLLLARENKPIIDHNLPRKKYVKMFDLQSGEFPKDEEGLRDTFYETNEKLKRFLLKRKELISIGKPTYMLDLNIAKETRYLERLDKLMLDNDIEKQ